MLNGRLKAGLFVISLLLIIPAAAILPLSKPVEGHGVPEQFQSKIVRIDNEQFSDNNLNTGDTVTATGELQNQLDSDLKGLSFSITVETAVQGKAWEIVSTKPSGKVFDIHAGARMSYEMKLMALEPGVYHVHTQLNIPGYNMSLGRGQTINVAGNPINSNIQQGTQLTSFVPFPNILGNLRGAAINDDNGKLYITDSEFPKGFVSILNATTLEQIENITTDIPYASDIAIDETSNIVYLTYECYCPEASKITVINSTSDKVIGSVDAKDYPALKPVVDPFADKIYAITNGSFMSVIDLNSGNVSKIRIDTKTSKDVATFGLGTYDLALTPIPNTAYILDGERNSIIALRDNGTKIVYNVTIDSVPDKYAVDNRLVRMVVNPDTNILYVVNEMIFPPPSSNVGASIPTAYIAAINGSSGKILSENITKVNSFFFDLTVDPKRNIIYSLSGRNFVAINGSDNKVIDNYPYTTPGSFYPRKILANSETNTLYLVAPTGILKINSPASKDRVFSAGEEQQLLQKLHNAQDMLSEKLQTIPYEELPLSAWSVDEKELALAVMIDDGNATLPKQTYVNKLQDLLGEDIPVEASFGHVSPTAEMAAGEKQ
jgi:methane/ammonia monooxygenase subunit B